MTTGVRNRKVSETVRHPLFARMYTRLADQFEAKGGAEHRDEMLAGATGRVIEVGAGTGLNFKHYPTTVTDVLAVEPEVSSASTSMSARTTRAWRAGNNGPTTCGRTPRAAATPPAPPMRRSNRPDSPSTPSATSSFDQVSSPTSCHRTWSASRDVRPRREQTVEAPAANTGSNPGVSHVHGLGIKRRRPRGARRTSAGWRRPCGAEEFTTHAVIAIAWRFRAGLRRPRSRPANLRPSRWPTKVPSPPAE